MRMGERKATDMRRIRKLHKKRKNERGFTLVEMIVVLVIIAILAAITIPALLKYIDKAKDKQVLIDTRAICMATQSAMAEAYATDAWKNYGTNNGAVDFSKYYVAWKDGRATTEQAERYEEIVDLAGVSSLENNKSSFGAYVDNEGIVSLLIYRDGNGKVVFYFRETNEYNVYDETDFTAFESYFSSIKNRVLYINYYMDQTGTINPYLNRAQIKVTSGYKGDL